MLELNTPLPVPPPPDSQRHKRLEILVCATLLVLLLGYGLWKTSHSSESQPPTVAAAIRTFDFETVRLDKTGKEIERRKLQARYFIEDLGNGVRLEMVEIPRGKFVIGSPPDEANRSGNEGPQQMVSISSFWMSKFEVTQKQWLAVMGKFTKEPGLRGDDLPVERVSWKDAQEFLKKLNSRPNLQGKGYRLPTEAEWEYAARAGTTTPFAFGETITTKYVNFNYELGKTIPAGSLGVANAFGLFDMHGNVWEWCEDVYHENYTDAPKDGSAWLSGGDPSRRVLRGGLLINNCRSAIRGRYPPGDVSTMIGVRVVSGSHPDSNRLTMKEFADEIIRGEAITRN